MTRTEHERVVAEQKAQLAAYEAEMARLIAEAQVWVNRLRVLVTDLKEHDDGDQ